MLQAPRAVQNRTDRMKRALLLCALVLQPVIRLEAGRPADVASLKPEAIREFEELPPEIQAVLRYALSLTEENLGYQYGSGDPLQGGMDCSGTVSHVLKHLGYPSPRQSNEIYLWVEAAGNLKRLRNPKSLEDSAFTALRPGDLLFWEGTYEVGKRKPPTSHVMIYLGHLKASGKPVMVGASSGRYFAGKARHGVSVFDFVLPKPGGDSSFVGYGPVPGLAKLPEEGNGNGPLSTILSRLRDP